MEFIIKVAQKDVFPSRQVRRTHMHAPSPNGAFLNLIARKIMNLQMGFKIVKSS